MEPQPYVSCIKVNGVPILPPLMTDDIRSEVNYYKQLAIAIEKRLKILKITQKAEPDECTKDSMQNCKSSDSKVLRGSPYGSATEDSCYTETESSTVESVQNIETVINLRSRECSQDLDLRSVGTSCNESSSGIINQSFESVDNNESKCKVEKLLVTSTCSDMITASTDLNQYLQVSPPVQVNTETSPELMKPRVPKTLDIIPITVEVPNRETESYLSADMSRTDTPPQLVRQGSYILDAPSPMLLAHLQTELASPGYVPTTPTTSMKRKEWNISQARSEWENQIKNAEFVIPKNSKSHFNQPKCRRNSMCTVNNQKMSIPHARNNSPLESHRSARSVDCIQTMLAKESMCRSSNQIQYNQKDSSKTSSPMKSNNPHKRKLGRNVPFLNLVNRLGGSMDDLTFFGGQYYRVMDVKNSQLRSMMSEAKLSGQSPSRSEATSEKVVIIFKEIQRKHEEQMANLIAKQQKEQMNMQKEFEKQQVLLLSQIKKTFPFVSIPQAIHSTMGVFTDVPSGHTNIPNIDLDSRKRRNTVDSSIIDDSSTNVKCPLDYIFPLAKDCDIASCNNESMQLNKKTLDVNILRSNEITSEENTPVERSGEFADIYSNVSRELFPLDSNTIQVPVPVNTLYTANHIKASTIINAYARGYLIRRLMKTERVIALKSIYKEALHCMLKLHVDAPLNLPELNFHQRLQLQCDAASMNITELFAQSPEERMQVISQDREIKRSRTERPCSAHSYSFATQRTLARKKLKEVGHHPLSPVSRPCSVRSRCQTWGSNSREKRTHNIYHGIKRSTSAGTVRKPWR
ncbi:uncharacterized protein LOC105685459 isoform X1 [Athalia rosae]|uniref:uncharacterized protein LOC105685459 isoform X1 n=1 Tax=Athalia rosae TaxID=37344 RepID=UPI002033D430|nr:uncharacterized protein LOC105685459 isoform X1 [Athalia rosae]XP_012254972.2 uncharacterized protein LOC105685459 isoform X1 [Athalia rosae]XP_048509395.1 uncharacterized protein LOC105685459 isoform X1 [Athalia rosae]